MLGDNEVDEEDNVLVTDDQDTEILDKSVEEREINVRVCDLLLQILCFSPNENACFQAISFWKVSLNHASDARHHTFLQAIMKRCPLADQSRRACTGSFRHFQKYVKISLRNRNS